MSRRIRNLKKKSILFLHTLSKHILYRFEELSLGSKIALIASALCIIALFLPWAKSLDQVSPLPGGNATQLNSFQLLNAYIGYFLLPLHVLLILIICSKRRKEKLKYFTLSDIPERIIIAFVGIFTFILSFQHFFSVQSLQIITENITHGSGIILEIVGAILLFIAYAFMRKIYKQQNTTSYMKDVQKNYSQNFEDNKDNMQLPFE